MCQVLCLEISNKRSLTCRTSLSKRQSVNGQDLTSRFCRELEKEGIVEARVNAEWVERVPYARVVSSFSIISTTAKT